MSPSISTSSFVLIHFKFENKLEPILRVSYEMLIGAVENDDFITLFFFPPTNAGTTKYTNDGHRWCDNLNIYSFFELNLASLYRGIYETRALFFVCSPIKSEHCYLIQT